MAIYRSPYRELQIGCEEQLWLARMCIGEGGKKCTQDHALAMVWALVNRHLLHKWRGKWPIDFGEFARNFSQPINPRWQYGGDLATKHKSSESRLKRRARICNLAWDEIPENIQRVVMYLGHGILPPPLCVIELEKNRISNWAASTSSLRKKYPHGVSIGGNWFFEDAELEDGSVSQHHISYMMAQECLRILSHERILKEILRRMEAGQ